MDPETLTFLFDENQLQSLIKFTISSVLGSNVNARCHTGDLCRSVEGITTSHKGWQVPNNRVNTL